MPLSKMITWYKMHAGQIFFHVHSIGDDGHNSLGWRRAIEDPAAMQLAMKHSDQDQKCLKVMVSQFTFLNWNKRAWAGQGMYLLIFVQVHNIDKKIGGWDLFGRPCF